MCDLYSALSLWYSLACITTMITFRCIMARAHSPNACYAIAWLIVFADIVPQIVCFGNCFPEKWAEENLQIFCGLGGLILTTLLFSVSGYLSPVFWETHFFI